MGSLLHDVDKSNFNKHAQFRSNCSYGNVTIAGFVKVGPWKKFSELVPIEKHGKISCHKPDSQERNFIKPMKHPLCPLAIKQHI